MVDLADRVQSLEHDRTRHQATLKQILSRTYDLELVVITGFEEMSLSFEKINARLENVESDVATLKSDVSTLKSDVSTLKSDVATLKSDVATLKSDVATLKSDVAWIKNFLVVDLPKLITQAVVDATSQK